MPIDINDLSEGWLELESDPGKFFLCSNYCLTRHLYDPFIRYFHTTS